MDKYFATMIDEYKRAPKFHVTGYQAICLPRMASDSENGHVRLVVHFGNAWTTTWEKLESILKKSAHAVERKLAM